MTRIRRYIDCYIPTETCNLRCHYCYITQQRAFNNKLAHFSHSPEEIKKAFSKTRLGGICLINLCAGGETLLSEEVLPIVKALVDEGHYVMIVTNGTLTKRFLEISEFDEKIRSHIFIKFSFHYLEMLRLDMLERFAENVNLMKKSKVSFTVEITPSDELIPYIDDVKKYCVENFGALCHVTIARDDMTNGIDILSKLSFDEYKNTWSQFDSDLFNFKSKIFYQKRKEFCYAGDWFLYLNMETGSIRQCYCGEIIGNIFDLEKPIAFKAIGKCPLPHCYNGHSFLTLGVIPNFDCINYDKTRNRICSDGSEWLQSEMKEVMQSKLYETNKEYSPIKKYIVNKNNNKSNLTQKQKIKRLKRKAKATVKRTFKS